MKPDVTPNLHVNFLYIHYLKYGTPTPNTFSIIKVLVLFLKVNSRLKFLKTILVKLAAIIYIAKIATVKVIYGSS